MAVGSTGLRLTEGVLLNGDVNELEIPGGI